MRRARLVIRSINRLPAAAHSGTHAPSSAKQRGRKNAFLPQGNSIRNNNERSKVHYERSYLAAAVNNAFNEHKCI